jgi:hypothetical protein
MNPGICSYLPFLSFLGMCCGFTMSVWFMGSIIQHFYSQNTSIYTRNPEFPDTWFWKPSVQIFMILELPNWIISRFAWYLQTNGSNAIIGLCCELSVASLPTNSCSHNCITQDAAISFNHFSPPVADINPSKCLIISDTRQAWLYSLSA